ncbi:MAG: hypothetical protein WBX25_20170 [Rhodomicrobium sp.]
MSGAFAVAAKDGCQHTVLGPALLNGSYLPPAGLERVESGGVAPGFADVEPILQIQMGQESRADAGGVELGRYNPHLRKWMFPLRGQSANAICDRRGALGAIEFAGDDVAVHCSSRTAI